MSEQESAQQQDPALATAVAGADPGDLPGDGRTAALAVVDDGLALIAGVGDMMPATLHVLLNSDPNKAAQAAVVSWRRAGASADAPFGFAALVPLKTAARNQLESVVFRSPGRPVRYAIDRRTASLDQVFQAISEQAGPAFGAVVDGIVEALLAGQPNPRRMSRVAALLTLAARNDGFIEVMGSSEEGDVFVQGWASDLPQGRIRVISLGEAAQIAELTSGTFERDDLGAGGYGFAGLVEVEQALDPAALQQLFFRGRDGWRCIRVYEQRVLRAPAETPAHIRAILPRLNASGEVVAKLRLAAHRFDGRDTVSSLERPVRLGIDFAAMVDDGGIIISGWLLDPDRVVGSVTLRAGTQSAVLDESWTRQARPDVTEAFDGDPLFAHLGLGHNRHGFLAFAPRMAPPQSAGPIYLELMLDDGLPAYFPLATTRLTARKVVERLMSTLDPSSSTALNAIERQFGPMVQSLQRGKPAVVEVDDVGRFDDSAPLSLVIGSDGRVRELGILLSLLALDPETRSLPIILAGPSERLDEVGSEIRRLAAFYDLTVRLVFAEGVEDFCDALEAGISATKSPALALMSAHMLPRGRGWLSRLETAYRQRGGKYLVSPAILFEDESIRWAGVWLEGEGTARALVDRYVGYPRAVLDGAEPAEVTAGTMHCCVVSRSAFEAVEGFTGGYVGTAEKGLDLALKLKLAGTPSLWLPEVEMLGAEEDIEAGTHWRKLARRIDRWAFERRWSLAMSNMRS